MTEMQAQRINNILYGPKVDLPVNNKGLGKTIFEKFQEYRENIFLIDLKTDKKHTYKEVNQKCIRMALHMKERGLTSNDIVLLCAGNSTEAILPLFGTVYLNSVPMTLDPSISLRDTIHLLNTVPPKFIFVIEEAVELIENALKDLEIKPKIVVIGQHNKYDIFSDFLKPHSDENTFVPDYVENMDKVGVIFFSSGTTGLPKGICTSHRSLLNSCYTLGITIIDPSTTLFYTSFYWISAWLFTILAILKGGKILMKGKFSPSTFLEYVEKYEVTLSFLATSYIIQFNENNMKNFRTSNLTEILIGGSVMTPEQIKRVLTYFPNIGVYNVYGQTECTGAISGFSRFSDDLSKRKYGSCGVPYLNIELKVVDLDNRQALGPNQKGEFCIKTNTSFSGYYNKSSEDCFDKDGFLKTGDIGYYDEDNCVFISDRLKEMFKYQSWHIVPASIESVIYEHPAVLEAIVIGIPHEMDDHHPLALIVLKDDSKTTDEELLKFVNSKVIDREKLRAGLKIVKKIPKTCTGKIARQIAKQAILSGDYSELNG